MSDQSRIRRTGWIASVGAAVSTLLVSWVSGGLIQRIDFGAGSPPLNWIVIFAAAFLLLDLACGGAFSRLFTARPWQFALRHCCGFSLTGRAICLDWACSFSGERPDYWRCCRTVRCFIATLEISRLGASGTRCGCACPAACCPGCEWTWCAQTI